MENYAISCLIAKSAVVRDGSSRYPRLYEECCFHMAYDISVEFIAVVVAANSVASSPYN